MQEEGRQLSNACRDLGCETTVQGLQVRIGGCNVTPGAGAIQHRLSRISYAMQASSCLLQMRPSDTRNAHKIRPT